MRPDAIDLRLIELIQSGLPLVSRPYAQISETLEISEVEVVDRLRSLKQQGIIKRMGVIVKHRQLGYRANAMIVWDVPDQEVDAIGVKISSYDFVTLCYQRPRRGEAWPYNLFCMIHGKSRETVLQQIQFLKEQCQLLHYPVDILFSRRCFKQNGAIYKTDKPIETLELENG